MDSDNRHDWQPADPESAPVLPRVQPPGPSMEQWRASLECDITGGVPVASRAARAHGIDRSWNGPGIMGDAGRRAARTLRAEYLQDQDFAYDAMGTPAVWLSREGLHVRVRPGTTGIPEHLYGCPITLTYVDPMPPAGWPPLWAQLGPIISRLNSEQPPCILSWWQDWRGDRIGLEAWAVSVAEELHRRFGDQVGLTVGRLPYPPDRQPFPEPLISPPPETRELPQLLDPDEIEAELDGPAVVDSGHTLGHYLLLHNRSDRALQVATNGRIRADIVDPATGEIVGGYVGLHLLRELTITAAPGRSTRIPLLIDTASATPRLGYAVPPGHWGLQVNLTLGDGVTAPRRRTPILPLTITSPDQIFRPRKPRHRAPRHRRPGEASR